MEEIFENRELLHPHQSEGKAAAGDPASSGVRRVARAPNGRADSCVFTGESRGMPHVFWLTDAVSRDTPDN
jgi:hypothetical protein